MDTSATGTSVQSDALDSFITEKGTGKITADLRQALVLSLVWIGWGYFKGLFYTFLYYLFYKMNDEPDFDGYNQTSIITHWITDGLDVAIMIIFIIVVKNKIARTAFSIFLLLDLFFIVFRYINS